jgi:hypothetical protein
MTQTFLVKAAADPQTLPRILEHFTQRSLVPERFSAVLDGDMLHVEVDVAEMDRVTAELIGARIEQGVLVVSVDLNAPVANAAWRHRQPVDGGRTLAA